MDTDPQSLALEPLIYMLKHSGVFVTVLGAVFFVIGLLFGYATWGRYKRQTRELLGEAESMKDEIAQLKRRVGEQSVSGGPKVAMATETIHMPPRESDAAAAPLADAAVQEPEAERLRGPSIIPKVAANHLTDSAAAAHPAEAITVEIATADMLPHASYRHASALAAIITSHPHAGKELNGTQDDSSAIPPDVIPALSDLPALPAVTEVRLVEDPRLGLVYKSQPALLDDLTALKGIAKVLEKRLHDLGIYTYEQIASWNEAQVQEFSVRLAFKDRIHRERWVEQARELLAEKFDPAAALQVAA